ncbi:hypothetical protein [Flavobacterium sp. C4GT6]|uniref:hypothetical protein n=1 Tax=Flavobacterium sp. C4GT6 TaxID=3103818 RepID=UPI002ED28175|nr:hypothetical protein [Flavobacterium sp. C4GT6]
MKKFLILLLGIAYLISSLLFIKYLRDISVLDECGFTAAVKRVKVYSGDNPDNYYFNYYFVSEKNKLIWLTRNVDSKSLLADKVKYENKEVVYFVNEPHIYMTEDEIREKKVFFYFITLPLVFFAIGYIIKRLFIWKTKKH